MDWPRIPVERRCDFTPPHCPWSRCPDHHSSGPYRAYHRHGTFRTQSGRTVRRFRCLTCRHTFSTQTFSTSYYLKRPHLLVKVAAGLVAGSANRQIARSLRCSHSTVARQQARLGRHAILFSALCHEELRGRLREPVVFDHFETFELTQDFPFAVATAVASWSWFILGLQPAVHRRAGRISTYQRRRLEARPLRTNFPGYTHSTYRSFDALLQLVPPGQPLVLRTDGHKAYGFVRRNHPQAVRMRLESYPNPPRGEKGAPPSGAARLRDRMMFPGDVLHKLFRHSLAHQRRETIAFTRRRNAGMERFALMAVWRNFIKGRSERRSKSRTPAMAIGLTSRRWRWETVLSRRLFFSKVPLAEPWTELYRREWATPGLSANATHALVRAF